MTTPEQAREMAKDLETRTKYMGRDDQAAFHLRDLARQVEELQADAERYRWIRDKFEGTRLVVTALRDEAPSNWDAAIDSKRKAK